MITHYVIFMHQAQAQEILNVRKNIKKNPNLISTKNKIKLEYTNEEQSSSLELVLKVELDLNSI